MNKLKTLCTSVILIGIGLAGQSQAAVKLEQLWIKEGLSVPESTLVYREGKNNAVFVSQIDGDPTAVDGKGGIAKMTLDGDIKDPEWVTGLNAPKGMAAFGGKLYVADINQIVVINIKSAEVEEKISVAGAQFLNDVSIDSQGTIYVSDTKTNKVHRIQNGVVEDYLSKVDSANGVKAMSGNLVVGANTTLYLFDRDKNKLKIASGFAQAIDGVEPIGRGDFIVSCWAGLIYYVYLDGKVELLLDSQSEKINTADIGLDVLSNTLYVPNFSKNTVTAYKISVE